MGESLYSIWEVDIIYPALGQGDVVYFSDAFGISYTKRTEWFNPILDEDTKLFVDPFLIFRDSSSAWAPAHSELIAYFDSAFQRLAPFYDKPKSDPYKHVVRLLAFPEPREICLGYASESTDGSGTGLGLAADVVEAMSLAVSRGVLHVDHFEELSFLVEGIGPDRISDMTVNILKGRIIEYTQGVARRNKVPLQSLTLRKSVFDPIRGAWENGDHLLPMNPANGRPVLLIPKRFLRTLPTLNSWDWFDDTSSKLRQDLGLHVAEKVDKKEIVRLARARLDLVEEWTDSKGDEPPTPYVVDTDPDGIYLWLRHAASYLSTISPGGPATPPATIEELNEYLDDLIQQFKHWVTHEKGWDLLWNENKRPKREEASQLLFKGFVKIATKRDGVAVDREVNLGTGPVDFIVSTSARVRVLLEVKKFGNTAFWDGLETQLTTYLTSDECEHGWFLAVRLLDTNLEKDRTRDLASRTAEAASASGFNLRSDWLDARRQESASKRRKAKP